MNVVVVIQSERLSLREFEETDWQEVHIYASDPKVVHFMDWGPNAEEETKAFISRSISSQKEEPRKKYTLAITLKEENACIIGYNWQTIELRRAQIEKGRLNLCTIKSLG